MKPGDRIKHEDIQIGDVIHTVEPDGGYWYGKVTHSTDYYGGFAVYVKNYTGKSSFGTKTENGESGIILTGDDCQVTLLHR